MAMITDRHDPNWDHPPASAFAGITPWLILKEGGLLHAEALRTVVPSRKAYKGNPPLPLVLPLVLRWPDEERLGQAPLEPRFFKAKMIRNVALACEPLVQPGAHQRLVTAKVADCANAERVYQL